MVIHEEGALKAVKHCTNESYCPVEKTPASYYNNNLTGHIFIEFILWTRRGQNKRNTSVQHWTMLLNFQQENLPSLLLSVTNLLMKLSNKEKTKPGKAILFKIVPVITMLLVIFCFQ